MSKTVQAKKRGGLRIVIPGWRLQRQDRTPLRVDRVQIDELRRLFAQELKPFGAMDARLRAKAQRQAKRIGPARKALTSD